MISLRSLAGVRQAPFAYGDSAKGINGRRSDLKVGWEKGRFLRF